MAAAERGIRLIAAVGDDVTVRVEFFDLGMRTIHPTLDQLRRLRKYLDLWESVFTEEQPHPAMQAALETT